MSSRAGLVGLMLLLLISCTAAVRYGDNVDNEKYRPKKRPAETAITSSDYTTSSKKQPVNEINQHPRRESAYVEKDRMNRIVADYLGTPYARGGTGRIGMDCSGLIYVLYRDYDGTRLPLSTDALYRLDKRVDFNDLTYGDLVFFRPAGRSASHVGMYLENNRFVHASESRGVTVDELTTEYFATSYAGARRIR